MDLTGLKFERDPIYRVPKLVDENEIIKFEVVDSMKKYKDIDIPDMELAFKDLLIHVKGKYLNPASAVKIENRYPETKIKSPLSYDIYEIKKEKLYLLPKQATSVVSFYNAWISDFKKKSSNCTVKDISIWISLFCVYGDEFTALLNEYLISPDPHVGLLNDDEFNQLLTDKFNPIDRSKVMTEYDVRSTCHLIIISMTKSFVSTTERDEQVRQYLIRRKSAVYSSLDAPIGDLLFPDNFFTFLSDTFKILPKLMRTLFLFAYKMQQTKPEFATACVLLSYTSMTVLKLIYDFMYLPTKTLAHSNPIILEEVSHFYKVTKKKLDEDGALWPYHRLLYPTDGYLNVANFPNLAVCAVEYFKKHGPKTFKKMVTPKVPTIPGIVEKCMIYDHRPIFSTPKDPMKWPEVAKKGADK